LNDGVVARRHRLAIISVSAAAAAVVAVHAAAVLCARVRHGRRVLGHRTVTGARVHAAAGVRRLVAVVHVRCPGPRVSVHQVRFAAVLRRLH